MKTARAIVKNRILILTIGILLLIPSVFGYLKTRVNYDILSYLPENIDTMEGQNILLDEFHKGGFAMEVIKGMDTKDVSDIKKKIEEVDGVADVIWYDTIADTSVPMEIVPEEYRQYFLTDDATLMAIFFDDTTSADTTMNAVEEIRSITNEQCYLSGMSSVVTDIKNMADEEMPIYVLIAVVLTCIVLAVSMDSWVVPIFFMLSIGMAVLYNLGTNIFLGETSYITKALSAVLQLGVTLDYSIFLWHSYEENQGIYSDNKEAMAHAITNTFSSVVGSSTTTVAGFVALCFMSFTLGKDMGIVMAKGVVFGVIACVTILPSLILTFDKAIQKTKHRPLIPNMDSAAEKIIKHYKTWFAVFFLVLIPALYGYNNTSVYYNLDRSLPDSLPSSQANAVLAEEFDMNATHMVLASSSLSSKDAKAMLSEMQDVDGVKFVLGMDSVVGSAVPKEILPSELKDSLEGGDYQLILVQSEYKVASDEVNAQCEQLNSIIKKYDSNAMLIGEAPCTKDLIEITNNDFNVVNAISIVLVFLIIAIQFKSISLPIILVAVIEFAIFINMGIPYYTGTELPFIASIIIGTIQLGATVDYAILMTTRYLNERSAGKDKKDAITVTLKSCITSIIVSAFGFFGATIGCGVYSNIDMISSLCTLMARGAIISMLVVILILPSMLMVFDGLIMRSTKGMKHCLTNHKEETKEELKYA